MSDDDSREPRRRFLRIAGTSPVLVLAGCLSDDEGVETDDDRPDDYCFDQLEGSVPAVERNAVSIDGVERKDESELLSKEDAAYQCGPQDGQLCGNCTFYIDDKDGDGIGACTEVEGMIRSVDWCGIWAAREKAPQE
ncbi:high-potential iron-sulfur protein [Halosolutus amylolyticus]|uniref:High-potential iron-sulfur protein n=1 Tax=Halosolutus amylolyticus TaxID=2932267 RepID=A0ABD5PTB7_9EURY|nr:high-potential iron-sulfur protein [Halosolutus amylolyticus]